jgi:hypothetical protein
MGVGVGVGEVKSEKERVLGIENQNLVLRHPKQALYQSCALRPLLQSWNLFSAHSAQVRSR